MSDKDYTDDDDGSSSSDDLSAPKSKKIKQEVKPVKRKVNLNNAKHGMTNYWNLFGYI